MGTNNRTKVTDILGKEGPRAQPKKDESGCGCAPRRSKPHYVTLFSVELTLRGLSWEVEARTPPGGGRATRPAAAAPHYIVILYLGSGAGLGVCRRR
jgi:hypothetical protein